MSKFAKLFERGDDQVLVVMEDNDEGKPSLACTFQMDNEATVKVALVFDKGKYDKQQSAFDAMDETTAFGMREATLVQFREHFEE